MLEVVNTKKAPAAIGPYSQAIKAGNMLFVSGQLPVDPEKGEIVENEIQKQTEMSLKNLVSILEEAKINLNNVVKTTVFLSDMNNFVKMNDIYAKYFNEHKPARACVEVARLPKDVLVEIEAIAIIE